MDSTKRIPAPRARRQCAQCGNEYPAFPSSKRKYCSHGCYARARLGVPNLYLRKTPIIQVCEACGEEFEKGRDTGRNAALRFCSRHCSSHASFKNGTEARQMTIADVAYLAGLVDGEGCICLYRAGRTGPTYLRLSIANTHTGVVDWCCTATEVGAVHGNQNRGPRCKPQSVWACTSHAACSVLRQVLPHLKVKRAQAELALDFMERKLATLGQGTETWDWQEECRLQMQVLNKRGPT